MQRQQGGEKTAWRGRHRVWSVGLLVAAVVVLVVGEVRPDTKEPVRTDRNGDQLPEGVLARLGTLRWRHGGTISFVAYLPDGKGVVTAGHDNTIRLWDRESGKEIRRFSKAAAEANAPRLDPTDPQAQVKAMQAMLRTQRFGMGGPQVALAPDGKTLAVTTDSSIQLWEVATGKSLREIKGPQVQGFGTLALSMIAFSPDSKILAGRGDQTVYLWETESGKELRQIKGKQPEARGGVFIGGFGGGSSTLVFSPDSKTLVTGEIEFGQQGVNAFLRLSEVATGKEIRRVKADQTGIAAAAFSPDGKILAYALGNAIHLTEANGGKDIRQLKGNTVGTTLLTFAPDGKTLATRGLGNLIRLWDTETGQETRQRGDEVMPQGGAFVFAVGFGPATTKDVAFSPDSKVIAVGGSSAVRFWEVATGKEVAQGGHRGPVTAVVVSADGKTVVSKAADNTVRRWEPATAKELSQFAVPAGTTVVALAPDGQTIVLGNRDNTIRLHDTVTGNPLHKLTGHANGIAAVAFSADGKMLASRGASDNTLRLYDTAAGKELRHISLMVGGANPMNPGGAQLITVGFGGSGPTLAFSPDGKLLATPGPGQANARVRGQMPRSTLNLYDTITGKEVRKIELPANKAVTSFAFSPDSRALAVDCSDQTITVYEVASGSERLQLGGARANQPAVGMVGGWTVVNGPYGVRGQAAAASVVFAPDGKTLAAKNGNHIHIWDVVAGKEIKQLKGHQGPVLTLAFAPDGKTLATGSDDTTILLWDLRSVTAAPQSPVELSAKDVEALWSDLLGTEGGKAFRGIQQLSSAPKQAVSFLKEQLKPAVPVEKKVLAQLITDLESDKFPVRAKAMEELEKLGDQAVPPLEKVLAGDPPLETRKRAEELLEKLTAGLLSGEQLRLVRAVEVLEQVGTPEARQVLEALAKGAAGALPTREARAALVRLTRTSSPRQ